jgi:Copper amine oxidase N-terminal domain
VKKKVLLSVIGAVFLAASFAGGIYAASALKLVVNGVNVTNAEPKIINNRTYVPLRAAAELLGAEVNWDSKTNTVTVNGEGYNPTPGKTFTVNVNGSAGPMKISISKVTLDNSYNYDQYSNPIRAVVMDVTVENTSTDTINWHPDQGILVLNTKEQNKDPLMYSDDLGGEFHGKVIKKGKIAFKTTSAFNSITDLRFIISGPFNSDFDNVGDELSLDIKLN